MHPFEFLSFIHNQIPFVCDSYSFVLRHTTEEVLDACIEAIEPARAAQTSHLQNCVMTELAETLSKHSWFTGFDIVDEPPMKFSLEQWINHAKESQAIVFIAGFSSFSTNCILLIFLVYFSLWFSSLLIIKLEMSLEAILIYLKWPNVLFYFHLQGIAHVIIIIIIVYEFIYLYFPYLLWRMYTSYA